MKSIKYILLLFCLACQKELNLKKKSIDDKNEITYTFPEELPEYPGGQIEMFKFITKSIKAKNIKNHTCTKVFVKFTIKKSGDIDNVSILKSNDFCLNFEKEIIKAISNMPKWKAGKVNGKLVDSEYTLPLSFDYLDK